MYVFNLGSIMGAKNYGTFTSNVLKICLRSLNLNTVCFHLFVQKEIDTTITVDGIRFDGSYRNIRSRGYGLLKKEPATINRNIQLVCSYISKGKSDRV